VSIAELPAPAAILSNRSKESRLINSMPGSIYLDLAPGSRNHRELVRQWINAHVAPKLIRCAE